MKIPIYEGNKNESEMYIDDFSMFVSSTMRKINRIYSLYKCNKSRKDHVLKLNANRKTLPTGET